MYRIFLSRGGIGKDICSTVPIRNLKKKYPEDKIITVSGHPEVYKFNPNVEMSFGLNPVPNFHEMFKGAIWHVLEPYYHPDYVSGKKHMSQCWCEQLGIPFDNPIPDIILSAKEDAEGLRFVQQRTDKMLLVQLEGGGVQQQQKQGCPSGGEHTCPTHGKEAPKPVQPMKQFVRNLPRQIAKNVITEMAKTYKVVSLGLPHQKMTQDFFNGPIRQAFAIIKYANKMLLIDSFAQHVAAAFDRKAVVLWGATNPVTLGYELHHNIILENCPTPLCGRPNSYLNDVDWAGQPWECKHDERCMWHSEEQIIKAIKGE